MIDCSKLESPMLKKGILHEVVVCAGSGLRHGLRGTHRRLHRSRVLAAGQSSMCAPAVKANVHKCARQQLRQMYKPAVMKHNTGNRHKVAPDYLLSKLLFRSLCSKSRPSSVRGSVSKTSYRRGAQSNLQ